MKSFYEIYNELENENKNELNSSWEKADKERKKSKKISLIICLIIDIFFAINFLENGIGFTSTFLIMFVLVSNIIIFGFVSILFSKNYNKYAIEYKNIVINKLMSNFYNNLEYFPDKPMPEYIYKDANYNECYDIYRSEDYLEGQIDNTYSIQMGEVKTQEEEEYRDSDGDKHTRIVTKFHGLFSKISLQKTINSELRIMQNGQFFLNKKRLQMDSSEFEKCFDVKATDKIIGMQILTSDVMQELIDFQNNTNIKYDITIKNDELYLRFYSGEMFEVGKLKNGAMDKETVKKYFYMLNFTYNLSKKIINVINDTMI